MRRKGLIVRLRCQVNANRSQEEPKTEKSLTAKSPVIMPTLGLCFGAQVTVTLCCANHSFLQIALLQMGRG
jgi:hypothetical protein